MTVLIVDDNSANRLTLKWILSKEGYTDVSEAINGQDAINACKNKKYDLIFMDVMMPGMTGIEATIRIKEIAPNSMIIAATALDDDETTREMFKAGAEDYITKPIQQDVFKARFYTYIKIIENRNFQSLNTSSINIFKIPVSSHFCISKVQEEGNLVEFWERYLLGSNDVQNENLCSIVAKIFNIGTLLLKMEVRFSIFFEENTQTLFFTINNAGILNRALVEEMICKDGFRGKYLIADDKISFSAEKPICAEVICSVANEPKVVAQPIQNGQNEDSLDDNPVIASVETISAPLAIRVVEETFVFDYMDESDNLDIEEYIKDLDRYLILIQSSKLEPADVQNLSHKIEKIASILSVYHETYELGMALKSLAYDIKENVDEFISNSKSLSVIFASFTKDLLEWYTKLFRTGATTINFFDATIIANAMMMSSAIKPREVISNENEMDDIFF